MDNKNNTLDNINTFKLKGKLYQRYKKTLPWRTEIKVKADLRDFS